MAVLVTPTTVAGAALVVDVMRDRTIRVMASERYGEPFRSAPPCSLVLIANNVGAL